MKSPSYEYRCIGLAAHGKQHAPPLGRAFRAPQCLPQGRVYAIEPNPHAAAKLRRSVALNGLTDRTTVIEAAAGNSEGAVTLFVPHGEPKNSTVIAKPQNAPPPSAGTLYNVSLIKLDQLAETTPRIDLIKIDAEGAEQHIVHGMMGILQRDKPNLLLEFNPARYIDAAGFLESLMTAYERMRYVNFEADAAEVSAEQIVQDRSGEDWLLFFDNPGTQTVD